jgi:ADP-ribose pyrophosphatase
MKFLTFTLLLNISTLLAFHDILPEQLNRIDPTYLYYLKELNEPKGDHSKGEIEIVLDPADIGKIQRMQKEMLIQKGLSNTKAAQFSRIGIVAEDQYIVWFRDAVYFPKKIAGTYDRILWKNSFKNKSSGVAVLPILPSGDIVLNLNYRHSTRSWELELPRGAIEGSETDEQAAIRELQEETGFEVESIASLGKMAPDTSILSSIIPVFIGFVSKEGTADQEFSEAIASTPSFSKKEIKAGLIAGALEVTLNGKKELVPLRDPFLTFALFQAEARELL